MSLNKKRDYKLNKYLGIFEKVDMDGILSDLADQIATIQAGNLGADAVGTVEIQDGAVSLPKLEAAVQTSVGKADTAVQPGVANDITDGAAAGTLADLSEAEVAIDAIKDKVNEVLAELRLLGLLN